MAEDKQKEARNRNLMRFVHAQDSGGIYDGTGTYAQALEEVKAGYKRRHWIWYVFPQMKGLGKSKLMRSLRLPLGRRSRFGHLFTSRHVPTVFTLMPGTT